MVAISEPVLEIAQRSDTPADIETVTVSYSLTFTAKEKQCNHQYKMQIYLYEIDDGRDTYYSHGANRSVSPSGDQDDFVAMIKSKTIRPKNHSGKHSYTVHIDFGDQESGEEEYQAVVVLSPKEIVSTSKWSKTVIANVG